VRTQAGFQSEAGQLARVENGRDVAHLVEGFFEGVAEHRALLLQVAWQTAFEPFTLQFGCRQQLTDVVMQFTAEAVALVFLDFQQAVGQFLGLELDRFARQPILHPDTAVAAMFNSSSPSESGADKP
jgi:hypothetical protein